ncbi:MAG: hypothetical protein OEW52_05080 [Thermoleophilia bacterium]|nr:hypothetical protein [Thermoleophilia bacterium]MDH4345590.1 hypothetical protein [Thermoleophilia bacterium]MDH5280509.1 hypothetical protein [Thermoleophilia bacterium]
MKAILALCLAGACLAAGAAATSAAGEERTPALQAVPGARVLTLVGRGFVPRERVVLRVFAGRLRVLRVSASVRGAFVVRFPGAPVCVAWTATVTGTRTGRVRFRNPVVDCRRSVDPAVPIGGPPVVGTGIAGEVRRGPIRPVCVAELPCDGPAPGVVVEVVGGGGMAARTMTGGDGRFVVYVPPGSYTVAALVPRSEPVRAQVREGSFTDVSLSIDTGIR